MLPKPRKAKEERKQKKINHQFLSTNSIQSAACLSVGLPGPIHPNANHQRPPSDLQSDRVPLFFFFSRLLFNNNYNTITPSPPGQTVSVELLPPSPTLRCCLLMSMCMCLCACRQPEITIWITGVTSSWVVCVASR